MRPESSCGAVVRHTRRRAGGGVRAPPPLSIVTSPKSPGHNVSRDSLPTPATFCAAPSADLNVDMPHALGFYLRARAVFLSPRLPNPFQKELWPPLPGNRGRSLFPGRTPCDAMPDLAHALFRAAFCPIAKGTATVFCPLLAVTLVEHPMPDAKVVRCADASSSFWRLESAKCLYPTQFQPKRQKITHQGGRIATPPI